MTEQIKFDVRGLFVPENIFKIEIEMRKIEDGDRILVLSDDTNIEEWLIRWAHKNGHEVISVDQVATGLNITLKKGGYKID